MAKRGKVRCFYARVPGRKKRKRVCIRIKAGAKRRRRKRASMLNGVAPARLNGAAPARACQQTFRCVLQQVEG